MVILGYVIRRLISIIPALLLMSALVFLLKVSIPDDFVDDEINRIRIVNPSIDDERAEELKNELRQRMGLDLPVFYFSLTSAAIPDTLHRIFPKERAEFLRSLLLEYGDRDGVSHYFSMLEKLQVSSIQEERRLANRLFGVTESDQIENLIGRSANKDLEDIADELLTNIDYWSIFRPVFHWNGSGNQFHRWLVSIMTLSFGQSIVDGEQVSTKIAHSLKRTLMITIPALFFLLVTSIPLGAWLSFGQTTWRDFVRSILLSVDAVPLFWLSILLILIFSSGLFFNILPAFGMIAFASEGFSWNQVPYLVLPIISLTLAASGYMTIQVMKAFEDEQGKLYVLSARARGLSEWRIAWSHIFRNTLVPIITIFSDYLAAAFAGSLVVEIIFSIPGMGKLLFDSVAQRDFNVILGIILLTGLIKMIANLLADISYRLVNPMIRFS